MRDKTRQATVPLDEYLELVKIRDEATKMGVLIYSNCSLYNGTKYIECYTESDAVKKLLQENNELQLENSKLISEKIKLQHTIKKKWYNFL